MPLRLAPLVGAVALLLAAAAPAAAQDPAAEPAHGTLRLRRGFRPDPYAVAVTAGGPHRAAFGSCSYGFVPTAPAVNFSYVSNGRRTLYVYAEGGTDTTLLVQLPDGRWICNDDGIRGSRNPLLVFSGSLPGVHHVWVGTYGTGTARATLHFSETDPR